MRVQGAVSVLDLVGRREMVEKLVAHCEARLAQEHKLAEEEMGGAVGGRGGRSPGARGSCEKRLAQVWGEGAVEAGACAGDMVPVWVAGEGEEGDDGLCKRRSVSLDVDNKYEVVLRTIENNVKRAQAKLQTLEARHAAVGAAVGATVERARRLAVACEHPSAAHAAPSPVPAAAAGAAAAAGGVAGVLAAEVCAAEEEAKRMGKEVDADGRAADALANEVQALTHVCSQQLIKWRDLVARDMAPAFHVAFPEAPQLPLQQASAPAPGAPSECDDVRALGLAAAVEALEREVGEVECGYAAAREEVCRRRSSGSVCLCA